MIYISLMAKRKYATDKEEKTKEAVIAGYGVYVLTPKELDSYSGGLLTYPIFSSEKDSHRGKMYKTVEEAKAAARKKYPKLFPKSPKKEEELDEKEDQKDS